MTTEPSGRVISFRSPKAVLAINSAGFKIIALKYKRMNREEAESFYSIHSDKPFFNDLVTFMTRGPIIAAALEKDNAVEEFRKLIGSTDPLEALDGTIRKKFAKSKGENAVHGSYKRSS